MLSLWDKYKNIKYELSKNESYYHKKIIGDKLFGENSKEECYKFIKEHFEDGRKQAVMNVLFRNDKDNEQNFLKSIRPVHTISLYLLGITLYELYEEILKQFMKVFINNIEKWYDFRYTWFLTCFYHDIVSCEEAKKYDMSDLKNNLEYTVYSHVLASGDNYKPYFQESVIKKYWKFREEHEHGIGAGYYFFDSVCRNFYDKTKGKFQNVEEEIIENVSWRKEHLDHFAYIADAIICHNIWYAFEKDAIEKYKRCNLFELIINSNEDRVYIEQSPLYFILCLLDTIEPLKKFKDKSAEYVLKNIFINVKNKNICIQWSEEIQSENEDNINEWKKSIRELEKWLGVNVVEDSSSIYVEIIRANPCVEIKN